MDASIYPPPTKLFYNQNRHEANASNASKATRNPSVSSSSGYGNATSDHESQRPNGRPKDCLSPVKANRRNRINFNPNSSPISKSLFSTGEKDNDVEEDEVGFQQYNRACPPSLEVPDENTPAKANVDNTDTNAYDNDNDNDNDATNATTADAHETIMMNQSLSQEETVICDPSDKEESFITDAAPTDNDEDCFSFDMADSPTFMRMSPSSVSSPSLPSAVAATSSTATYVTRLTAPPTSFTAPLSNYACSNPRKRTNSEIKSHSSTHNNDEADLELPFRPYMERSTVTLNPPHPPQTVRKDKHLHTAVADHSNLSRLTSFDSHESTSSDFSMSNGTTDTSTTVPSESYYGGGGNTNSSSSNYYSNACTNAYGHIPSKTPRKTFNDSWLTGGIRTSMRGSMASVAGFTGSPLIEETNSSNVSMEEDNVCKIRRLNLDDEMTNEDSFVTSAHSSSGGTHTISRLACVTNCKVDKKNHKGETFKDLISPTDITTASFTLPSFYNQTRQPSGYSGFESNISSSPLVQNNVIKSAFTYNCVVPETPMMQRKGARSRMNMTESHNNLNMDSTMEEKSNIRFDNDFEVLGQLGKGAFGLVYKCRSRLDGCLYAVKASKRRATSNSDRARMLNEVKSLARVSDLADTAAFHILRYHQAWMEEGDRLHIVTELCTSTVQSEMKSGLLKTNIPRQYKLLREMLLALRLIHDNGICHLDIKPENIFVKDDKFKLGDFGLASKISVNGEVEEGDSRYMCMGLLHFGNHNDLTKCDLFSLGITMYEIVMNQPLPVEGEEWQKLRAGKLSLMHGTPLALKELIASMMNPDMEKRPGAKDLLTRRQLLSKEEKELIVEKNKVRRTLNELEAQMKRLTPPRSGLQRSNTLGW